MSVKITVMCLLVGAGVVDAQVQLNIQPGVQLNWPTPNTTNTYHLQWSPSSGGAWSTLVAVAGNGTSSSFLDLVPSGTRIYQVLDIFPGTPATLASTNPPNGGFETGSGSSATGWTLDTAAGGPVYGVRTNDGPQSGSFDFRVHLASIGAGPVAQLNQSGIPVTGGTTYPFSFYAKALSGSAGYNAEWRILWNAGGDTGYHAFTPGNGAYALISTSVTAPASATSATIYFHFAGAASPSLSANIDLDEVSLGTGASVPGSPAATNVLQVASQPVAQINWPSTAGVQYFPESTTDLAAGPWTNNFPAVMGDGTAKSVLIPMTNTATFVRLRIPAIAVLPPTNLHQIPSGSTNSISVAWTPSATPGVTGYRVLYGDISGTTTNTTDLGNVTSTAISGLASGVTYFVSVITLHPNGLSNPADATIQAQVTVINDGVLWSDEFDGDVIDPGMWTYDVGGGGFGNGQFEYNTARHENSYIQSGSLVIEARRENYLGNQFTSARMLTQGRFAYLYGDLEARIKLPNTANGLWPAFWMMGNNAGAIEWPGCGEIDIVEMGSKAGIDQGIQQELINSAVHYSNATNGYSNYVTWTNTTPVDLTLDYHLYKMSWTPTAITFYLDGVSIGSLNITPNYFSEFHQPHFPIMNIAVGGYNPSYTGVYSPAGVTATMPARMYVDWIRVSDNGYTELYFGDDNAESGNFGVFTDTTPVNHSLAYGTGSEPGFEYGSLAALYTWNNMTAVAPPTASEGTNCWSFNIAAGNWFGMGVLVPNFRNMKNYSDGYLHVDLKTTGTSSIKVGIKSSRGGEFWLPLGVDGTSEFGFARDGQWHTLRIPLNRFANTDFRTIHQLFMIAGDPGSAMNLSIDNVWWEPSAVRPTPQNGNFGVYTETASNKNAGEFGLGVQGNFFIWENTLVPTTQSPYEGSQDMSLQSAPGPTWFGAAFTPNIKFNLTAFRYSGCKLEFAMKTSSSTTFMIGMKSGNMDGVGQKWITFQSGSDPYGFARDGQWHVVSIPMSDFAPEVDLGAVSQLFQILGVNGPISRIEFDDIHFTNGGAASTPNQ